MRALHASAARGLAPRASDNALMQQYISGVKIRSMLIALALLSLAAEAAEPRRVLIIYSFGRDFGPFNAIAPALRAELVRAAAQPVIFHEASLDVERHDPPEDEQPFVQFLLNRYAAARPDLVVVVAAPALRFYLRHRQWLFPDTPLLVTGIDQRVLKTMKLGASDRAVSLNLDFPRIAESILQLLPETTTLAFVVGASPFERFWLRELQTDLAPLADRVKLVWLSNMTLAEVRSRVAALPPRSAVFYGMFAVDSGGVPYENEQALAAVRAASSAPVFGIFDTHLGEGIVGGPLWAMRKIGTLTGQVAHRMLQDGGDSPGANLYLAEETPIFDWRELKKWSIASSRLPAGSEIRFRPPSLWETHKTLILAGAAIVVLQAALIVALLLQRVRRRRAEAESLQLTGRVITAHEDERRRIARELHDDLTQRLARLAIDAARIERNAPVHGDSVRELREDLVRMSEDVHALSYRLHPSVLDDLGLVEALKSECDRVARQGGMRVAVDARDVPKTLSFDASLCLFRIAQEALNNAARHAEASAITVQLAPVRGGIQLAVKDDGNGFDPGRNGGRSSLGLASMRERVRMLDGRIVIDSAPGRGTTVRAWVPARAMP